MLIGDHEIGSLREHPALLHRGVAGVDDHWLQGWRCKRWWRSCSRTLGRSAWHVWRARARARAREKETERQRQREREAERQRDRDRQRQRQNTKRVREAETEGERRVMPEACECLLLLLRGFEYFLRSRGEGR